MIAEEAADPSAGATADRERYLDIRDALWKLGVRLRLPDDGIPRRR